MKIHNPFIKIYHKTINYLIKNTEKVIYKNKINIIHNNNQFMKINIKILKIRFSSIN